MEQIDTLGSSLSFLPEDVWCLVAEEAGMVVLKRLLDSCWRFGWFSLAVALHRVHFRHLTCPAFARPQQEHETLEELLPHMAMFAQLNAEEIEIKADSNLMTPERLYLAARILATPEQLRSMDYSADRATLEAVPWLKNWQNMKKIVLVRNQESSGSLGSFAALKSYETQ